MSCYSAADIEEIITNKEEGVSESLVLREANPGFFASICKKLTVKQYTKDSKNYFRMPE